VTDSERDGAGTPYECDALIVGSGAAGMSAAITAALCGLNVLVEKEPRFGGTTARSGGWLWISRNVAGAGLGHL
jgi:succinate dehydrogenase/fumarate reductase flavoprotein subunit